MATTHCQYLDIACKKLGPGARNVAARRAMHAPREDGRGPGQGTRFVQADQRRIWPGFVI